MKKWKDKSPQEKYDAYQKLNKTEKLKKAQLEGFDDIEAFRKHLKVTHESALISTVKNMIQEIEKELDEACKEESSEKPIIHNVHILDASGSMHGSKLKNAIKGINMEIDNLKKETEIEYFQTIVRFGSSVRISVDKQPISEVGFFDTDTIGMTALYRAIGETLERCVKSQQKNEKVLIKIFTDGGENHSTGKYENAEVLKSFIKKCENKGFTITFVGTEMDVEHMKERLGIDNSNTLVHNNTAKGVEDSFTKSYIATTSYTRKVAKGEDVKTGFYKEIL